MDRNELLGEIRDLLSLDSDFPDCKYDLDEDEGTLNVTLPDGKTEFLIIVVDATE